MSLDEFVKKYNGQKIEVAGQSALNQCVDLANAYIREVLGLPIIEWTNAKDFPLRGGDNYDYILNTPDGVPQKGDLVVWGGQYGHIAIFLEGNVNSFRSFDQNFPTGSACHIQDHTYANVLGWMRAKATGGDTVTIDTETFERLVTKATKYDEFVAAGFNSAAEVTDRINKLEEEKRGLDKQIADLKGINQQQVEMIDDLQEENTDLQKTINELEAKNTQLQLELDSCEQRPINCEKACPGWIQWLIRRFC